MTQEIDEFELDDQRRQRERVRHVTWGPREDGHVVVVMTCKGREALLAQTCASLNLPCGPFPNCVVTDAERVGQAATFFYALELAQRHPGFKRVTLIEDDVVGARNALAYIMRTVFDDDIAMHSWFHQLAPNPPRTDQPCPMWLIGSAREHSCNQAITLQANTVHALLTSKERQAWLEPHGADTLIGRVMPDAKVAYHFPNLVQHVGGNQSFVGNAGARTSPTFVGEDFDALDLTRAA